MGGTDIIKNATKKLPIPKNKAKFEIRPFQSHKLDLVTPKKVVVSRDDALKYYRSMMTIREMELKIESMWNEKIFTGFCHFFMGQEAGAVGIESVIFRDDDVITSYRLHGWAYTRGIDVSQIFAEVLGRKLGCGGGKGGSMHMYNHNFYGGNAIVGAQVPVGTGIAFAHKYKKDGRVCVVCYGDGAANQGQVFEAFNIAKLWKLPVIFVCENNKYGKYTSNERSAANTEYYTRGDYIPGVKVDGMDVLAVREATKIARKHALTHGPIVIELDTYRFSGHTMNDPGTRYRSQEEVEEMKKKFDPVKNFRNKIITSHLASEHDLESLEMEVKKYIKESVNKAIASPVPDLNERSQNVYQTDTAINLRGCTIFEKLTHDANI